MLIFVFVLEPLDVLYNQEGTYYKKAVVGKLKDGGPLAGWLWRTTKVNQRIDRFCSSPLWGLSN